MICSSLWNVESFRHRKTKPRSECLKKFCCQNKSKPQMGSSCLKRCLKCFFFPLLISRSQCVCFFSCKCFKLVHFIPSFTGISGSFVAPSSSSSRPFIFASFRLRRHVGFFRCGDFAQRVWLLSFWRCILCQSLINTNCFFRCREPHRCSVLALAAVEPYIRCYKSDLLVSRQIEPNISTFSCLVFHFIEANDFYFYMYKTGSGMYCKHGSVYFLVCWCSWNEMRINSWVWVVFFLLAVSTSSKCRWAFVPKRCFTGCISKVLEMNLWDGK